MLNSSQLFSNLAFVVKLEDLANVFVTTLVFVFLGLAVFGLAFAFILWVTPFSVRKELEEDHNTAIAIVIASIIIGISIIVGSAISG
jgi:putative membrane protein